MVHAYVEDPVVLASALQAGSLTHHLAATPALEFAVLIGSHATGQAHSDSDWDIALQWQPHTNWIAGVGQQETLRREIAGTLACSPDDVDLIDLSRANLAMRAEVAEHGVILKGEDTLAWARFLTRTWRELEDFYWEKTHAA